MNEKVNFTGGSPTINFNDLNRNNIANRSALFGIMEAFGVSTNENFIISGCVASVDTGVDVDVTAGYIYLNGEILEVEAQTVLDGGTTDLYKYVKAVTYDAAGDKTFNDAVARKTWRKNRGIVTAATTPIITTELDVIDGDRLVTRTQGQIRTKVIDIGIWDMTGPTKDVDISSITLISGFSYANIVNISVYIHSDISLVSKPLNSIDSSDVLNGGIVGLDTGVLSLKRVTGGDFDNVDYNNGAISRGFVTIDYKAY